MHGETCIVLDKIYVRTDIAGEPPGFDYAGAGNLFLRVVDSILPLYPLHFRLVLAWQGTGRSKTPVWTVPLPHHTFGLLLRNLSI